MIIGLNPALQRTITIPSITLGNVLRASQVEVGIGGKGQNVIIASTYMNINKPSKLLQFLGSGSEGDMLSSLLVERANVDPEFSVRSSSSCRTCITLLDESKNIATEIIEPSGRITEEEINLMYSLLNDVYRISTTATSSSSTISNSINGLAAMGSIPPGCPGDIYANIIALTCNTQSKV